GPVLTFLRKWTGWRRSATSRGLEPPFFFSGRRSRSTKVDVSTITGRVLWNAACIVESACHGREFMRRQLWMFLTSVLLLSASSVPGYGQTAVVPTISGNELTARIELA